MTIVFLVLAFAVLFISLGLWGFIAPVPLLAFLSRWQTRGGLWAGALLRLLFGVALWCVASTSRFPTTLQVVAGISIVAGVGLPFIGLARLKQVMAWWSRQSLGFTRAWSAFVTVLGVFIVWAVAG